MHHDRTEIRRDASITLNDAVVKELKMVGVSGVEPETSSLSGTRSNQLSYTPEVRPRILVELRGFEPLTPCLQSRCSSQLSYSPKL